MYVVIWEPKRGAGSGHQLCLGGRHKADYLQRQLMREMPDHAFRIVAAEDYAAEAVMEQGQQQQRRRARG